MESREDNERLESEQPAWVAYAKAGLLLGMALMFYLLGQSMVAHHFFSGE